MSPKKSQPPGLTPAFGFPPGMVFRGGKTQSGKKKLLGLGNSPRKEKKYKQKGPL